MGGGFELALGCDMIVATRSATFRFPEAGLGVLTLQGGVMQLAENIAHSAALAGRMADVAVAREWELLREIARLAEDRPPVGLASSDPKLFERWRAVATDLGCSKGRSISR
jgi:enoyl-CoA hydratase/carnithine racemase